jgi:redox-sensing transcriptional repressor
MFGKPSRFSRMRSGSGHLALDAPACAEIIAVRGSQKTRAHSPVPLTMDQPRPDLVPNPAVRRLSLYLRQLEAFKRQDRRTVSSRQLGESLGLTDAQVRKDFAYFGQFGHPGIGYTVDDLINRVKHILGTDKTWNVLLVGAGNLGRALLAYRGFEEKGFHLAAVFDADPAKIGQQVGVLTIQSLAQLPAAVEKHGIRLAIIAVPADAAQQVADQLVAAGIRGLLNFAPVSLNVPESVALNAVDLAVQLEQLSFQVNVGSAHEERRD